MENYRGRSSRCRRLASIGARWARSHAPSRRPLPRTRAKVRAAQVRLRGLHQAPNDSAAYVQPTEAQLEAVLPQLVRVERANRKAAKSDPWPPGWSLPTVHALHAGPTAPDPAA